MARIGFPYTLEMHKYMKKEMDKGHGSYIIHSTWPDMWKEGNTPSATSIRRRTQRIELLGIEGALRVGGEQKPTQKWTEEEEKDIILGYRECNGAGEEAARLIIGDKEFIKYFNLPSRSINDILSRMHRLQQEGQLEFTIPSTEDWTDVWIERWEDQGFTIIDPPDVIRNHTKIKVRCSSGHISNSQARYIISNISSSYKNTFCVQCAKNFVGGMPTGPEPALVYLLYFKEIDSYKPGYAEIGKSSSPKEAIHRTSKSRKYPWSYKIVAYDLSTKTNAGIHEQNILNDTLDSRTFIETQEFDGWTEFRTAKTIKYFKIEGKFNTWLK